MQANAGDRYGSRTGGCLCGAVRYQAFGKPLRSGICHCRSCRKTASAPALPFLVYPRVAVIFTEGEPAAFRSSAAVTRSFCGRCGSPLTYAHDAAPDHVDIMTCAMDDPDAFAPTFHVWIGEKLAWEPVSDDLPSLPEGGAPS